MAEPLLKIESISANYGPIEAIRDVSLEVFPGEIVTLIGSNGAGKTSTLHSISGTLKIRCGSITFNGARVDQMPAHKIVTTGLIQVPEGRRIFAKLSVLENLQLGAYIRNDKNIQRDLDRVMEMFPILKERKAQLGGTLSGGEQQMLAIGRALMTQPKLLLMDEPSMGIAPLLTAKIFETIQRLNEEGMTILLVEQNAHLALGIAKRAYVMETGAIVLQGDARALMVDPKVTKAYLGED